MKKSWKRTLIIVCVALSIGGVTVFNNKAASNNSVVPLVGYRVPPYSLARFPNKQSISLADYQGKPLFINFWASWCPPCQQESPDLVKAYAKYGNKVQFIGVNLTQQDSLSNVSAFLTKYGIKYPIGLDVQEKVAQEYQVTGIPASFFVNSRGIIVAHYVGAIPLQMLEDDLQRAEN